jgi:hypothetical protein
LVEDGSQGDPSYETVRQNLCAFIASTARSHPLCR